MASIKMSIPDIHLTKEFIHEIALVSSSEFKKGQSKSIGYGEKKKLISEFTKRNHISKTYLSNILSATDNSPRLTYNIFEIICREFNNSNSLIDKQTKERFKEWKNRQTHLFEEAKSILVNTRSSKTPSNITDIPKNWYLISTLLPIDYHKPAIPFEAYSIALITLFDNMRVSIKFLHQNHFAFKYFTGSFKIIGQTKSGLAISFKNESSDESGQIFIHLNKEVREGFLKTNVICEGYEWDYTYTISFENYEIFHSTALNLVSEVKLSKGKKKVPYRTSLDIRVLSTTDEVLQLHTAFERNQKK